MAEKEYQRLTRAKQRSGFAAFAARTSLWLGKDHLLSIETTGYTETYKRFYFRDIQAIIIRKTQRAAVRVLLFGVLAGIFAIFAGLTADLAARYTLAGIAGLFALAMLVDVAFGTSSISHLRTAVQLEELSSLNRLRRARKILNRIRPLIDQVQGQLSEEQIAAQLEPAAAASVVAPESRGSASPAPSEDQNVPPSV